MQKYIVTKDRIEVLDHIYEFNYQFIYTMENKEGVYIAENTYFNIFAYGDTVEDAERELYLYINELWEEYVEEDDDNLDESAKILKEKLINSIRKVM